VTAIYDIPVGEVWTKERIAALKQSIEDAGLKFEVVESLPVSEEIKLGTEKRDQLIENYKTSLINLAEYGVKTVTYNFMPVFDWTRSLVVYVLSYSSNILTYNHVQTKAIDSLTLNLNLPAWDESYSPERMDQLMTSYRETSG